MYTPVPVKKKNTASATFNRLSKKIDALRKKIKNITEEYNKAHFLFYSEYEPNRKKVIELATQFILRVRTLTKEPRNLTKKERVILNEILKQDLGVLLNLKSGTNLHQEVQDLFKELFGHSIEESFHKELQELKDMFKQFGAPESFDLSKITPHDSIQEILMKMGESCIGQENQEGQASQLPPSKPKSKKQLEEEEKIRQLEALKNQGIGSIYKRLVKGLHPDLEQDLEKRAEKDLLMKRLTVAYEQRDLIAMLALESTWLNGVEKNVDSINDETLKIYNALLKDQIEDLEEQLKFIPLDPRYLDFHYFIQDNLETPIKGMQEAVEECTHIANSFNERIKDISGNDALHFLKQKLTEIAERDNMERKMEKFFSDTPLKPKKSKRR